MLIDVVNNYLIFLFGFFGGWNFKGIIDVVFVYWIVFKFDLCCGLKCIFELKKDFWGGCDKVII